ncbi:hypothetical protein [Micromonospora purpureochromogenes]|uniref:Uncharacterized protein n=1 Tax=Micromonospora purpureochromogenes TaxID=47872 RepID=A0ABX2RTA0_9ACTN|nr:hypothetical protein [Micromonospora purpureochromogenes]NYF59764.1 hypothetical protein [Micromonospora purpureochromogenes]
MLTLLLDGEPPSIDTVEEHRILLRDTVERLGLTLIEVTPAATADEVHVLPQQPGGSAEPTSEPTRDLPHDDLGQLWPHVGLRRNTPKDVKAVKLREVMLTPAWSAAPPALQRQAESFLHDT